MNPFRQYLETRLAEHLRKHRVAVWYDPKSEFRPFVESLPAQPAPDGPVSATTLDGLDAALARFTGSFFEIKAAVEPLVDADTPDPLLIYIPSAARDKTGSVLMELELAGKTITWSLKSLARFCLREKFTDGVIDGILDSPSVSYADIVAFLDQSGAEHPSLLRTLFKDRRGNPALLAAFLADPDRDPDIAEKGAAPELFRLIASRLGFAPPPDTPLPDARRKTLRYILVNEFRADLSCDPPGSVAMIPAPQTQEQLDLACKTARTLRSDHPDAYAPMADDIAGELNLAAQSIAPDCLGQIDTFRFEEAALLSHVGELIRQGRHEDALRVADERKRSFWVDRSLPRQSQWRACRLMARLGLAVQSAKTGLKKKTDPPAAWVDAYCRDDGWHRVDEAQHALEAWVAKMEEEPENEASLETVRQAYEDHLQEMTVGFTAALAAHDWTVEGALPQTDVFSTVVEAEKTPTAYFLVDAMRFAMAPALTALLSGGRDLVLKPAVAVWPTITPLGMAALLPGAETGFGVIKEGGKLAAQVDGAALPTVVKRMKHLKARVPGAVEMALEKLLEMSAKKLQKTVVNAPLTVIRSQEIDALGELAGSLVARQLMDTMVGNVARAVKKLAAAGIRRFVITADHGHLFTRRKEDAFKTDPPGGQTLEIHRRCWIGHGGATPPGTVRLSGTQIGCDTDLEFIFPTGVGVFKTGGDLGFHHGGLSLQEMIVPVLTLKMGKEEPPAGPGGEIQLIGAPEEIANRTFGVQLTLAGLFDDRPFTVRPLLLAKGVIVGKAGMALDADYDPDKGDVTLHPGKTAAVGLILENDDVDAVRVVIQDPASDSVLAQSKDINVKLGTR
jgi:hypothetical protein